MFFHHCLRIFILITASSLPWINASDQTFALCDGQRGFIRCENGTKIRIVSANYGRTDDQVCPGGDTSTRTCLSKSSEIKVRWNCNGYSSCHLRASNQLFGNPCTNFSKYLEVKYSCIKILEKNMREKPIIAFNAYLTKTLTMHISTPVNIVYDGLILNYGNAYNPHHGIFTAPSAGLYIFTWTSFVDSGKSFNTELLVNGQGKGVANCHNSNNRGYENCANAVPVVLKKGDKVNIRTTYANSLIRDWSSFKGWKV